MEVQENFYEGYLDRVENGWVLGWAWRVDLPNEPIQVELYVDDCVAVTTSAMLYRADLERAGKGNGRHGFEVSLPKEYRDGATHIVQMRFGGSKLNLTGSPRPVCFQPSAGPKNYTNANVVSTPSFRSCFGGVWTDLSNALAVIDGKAQLGWVSPQEVEALRKWVRDGFVILPQAVSVELIDDFDVDVEEIWRGKAAARYFVEVNEDGMPIACPAGPNFKDRL